MSKDFEKRCHELEKTIDILQHENNFLSERAEETLLISLISDSIRSIDDKDVLLENILERISILKNIQYCSCGEFKNKSAIQNYSYAAFSDTDFSGSIINFSQNVKKELDEGLVFISEGLNPIKDFTIDFKNADFKPFSTFIFPFTAKSIPDGFFIFIDDEPDEAKFKSMPMLLQNIIDMVVEKLDKITLVDELKNLNEELDHRIKIRTRSLIEANQKLTEEILEHKRTEKALKESEDKYKELVQHAPAGIYEFDMEKMEFKSVNDVMCEYTGYSKNEFLRLDPLELLSEDSKDVFTNLVENVFANRPSELAVEYKIKGKNKKEFWVLSNARFFYEGGIPKRAMAVVHDLTEIRRAERERRMLETQLQQAHKMEAIGTLSGGIAHDFNNILSGIFGYTQLADTHINDPERAREYMSKIFEGAQRASSLIQQILTFSRQTEYNKQPLNFSIILKEALRLIRSTIPSSIEIRESINTKAIVLADSTQIHQVIMNLCTNAYQAMGDDGGILTVRLDEVKSIADELRHEINRSSDTYIRFEVGDTGSGIDDEIRKRIFDPYFTTKTIEKGTGLGLAVVDGIIKKHNGFIEFNTTLEIGTVFRVYLPVITHKRDDSEGFEKKVENLSDGIGKIMIVDDEPAILDTLKQILSLQGYDVSTYDNGESALQVFAGSPTEFDLIVTDMTMPKMTGEKLSGEVLKIRKDIPIIICTGYHENFSEEKALKAGIKKYIQKPVTGMELSKIIRELLGSD